MSTCTTAKNIAFYFQGPKIGSWSHGSVISRRCDKRSSKSLIRNGSSLVFCGMAWCCWLVSKDLKSAGGDCAWHIRRFRLSKWKVFLFSQKHDVIATEEFLWLLAMMDTIFSWHQGVFPGDRLLMEGSGYFDHPLASKRGKLWTSAALTAVAKYTQSVGYGANSIIPRWAESVASDNSTVC